MGLDLFMFKKKDFEDMRNDLIKYSEDLELVYGRKTWAIESWFASRSKSLDEDMWLFDVPESAWDEFYKTFSPYRDKLNTYNNRLLELEEKPEDDATDEDYVEMNKLSNEIDDMMNKLLGDYGGFQLGSDWESHALVRWIDAYPKVKEAYKEGPVYMEASF